ncbi:hypothetical protein [Butyrivibrio fibrisolvens]|nr:hypothetical protein [Butyrivibrio fibrisolvens]
MNLSVGGLRDDKTTEERGRDLRAGERDVWEDYYKRFGGTVDENHPEGLE